MPEPIPIWLLSRKAFEVERTLRVGNHVRAVLARHHGRMTLVALARECGMSMCVLHRVIVRCPGVTKVLRPETRPDRGSRLVVWYDLIPGGPGDIAHTARRKEAA